MSNNKQSSVEQLEFDLKLWFEIMKICFPTEIQNSINRSKAMRKEEIENAHLEGQCDETEGYPLEIAKKYYNDTFGGNNDE